MGMLPVTRESCYPPQRVAGRHFSSSCRGGANTSIRDMGLYQKQMQEFSGSGHLMFSTRVRDSGEELRDSRKTYLR